jgi:hypothetical protein
MRVFRILCPNVACSLAVAIIAAACWVPPAVSRSLSDEQLQLVLGADSEVQLDDVQSCDQLMAQLTNQIACFDCTAFNNGAACVCCPGIFTQVNIKDMNGLPGLDINNPQPEACGAESVGTCMGGMCAMQMLTGNNCNQVVELFNQTPTPP